MSSYDSSGESEYDYRDGIHKNGDSDARGRPPGSPSDSPAVGPQTPKSSPTSPRSPRSPRSPGLTLSDSQEPMSPALGRGQGPRSPPSPPPENADDGRSDISSGSSLLSHPDNKDEDVLNLEAGEVDTMRDMTNTPPSTKTFPVSTAADDLSDVSDLDDSDGLDDNDPDENKSETAEEKPEKTENMVEREREKERERQEREKKNSLNIDDGEQLDFEADDQEEKEKEEGEIEGEKPEVPKKKKKVVEEEEDDKSADEGEVKEDDDAESLEDGEVTDEGDPKPEKPPICRFFSRGACTWGVNCRFLHPGVTDKGNYTMFDVGRPMVATPNGGVPPLGYPPEHRIPYSHHMMLPPARVVSGPYGPVPVRREDPAAVESAWERGLRQAKEMMRKSTKRKETDMDFEEKKMNLSIGQDEIDKENDYYTRAPSPLEDGDGWPRGSSLVEAEVRRPAVRIVERYEDIVAEPVSPAFYEKYDYRRGYDRAARELPPEYLRKERIFDEEEYAAHKKARREGREKMVREVIVQRVEKPVREPRHHAGHHGPAPEDGGPRRKPDEWADPWMRSKSPSRKPGAKQRKTSYSSGSSSLSSRSGTRSSSNTSYSSYSRSRSRSLSNSRSPVPPRSRRPKTPPYPSNSKLPRGKKPTSPKDGKFKPLKSVAPAERSMMMNPPAPTPKRSKERPLSPSQMRKVGLNPPPPTPKTAGRNPQKVSGATRKAGKIRGRKSRSSSGSASSGSSSESSRSSYSSSSSSSKGGTPPIRPLRAAKPGKKLEPNERLAAQSLKGTAMDALKVSGQKPQIKLTLKPADAKRDKAVPVLLAGKKRPAEEPAASEPKVAAPGKAAGGKKTTSRREELLKQLKAVEDAIARKRSKI